MHRTLYALRCAFALTPTLMVQCPHNDERERLHGILSEFLSRGQLVVETMPPMTFLIRSIIARVWPTVLNLSPLNIGSVIGDILLISSGLLAFDLNQSSSWTRLTFLLETMALLSVLFGCNLPDVILCLVLIQSKRLFLAFRSLKNPRISMSSVALNLVQAPIFCFITMLACLVLIFTVVYPNSELSSGGNYNLRYLPADFRRNLRSPRDDVQLLAPNNSFNLAVGRPTTLYVQNAGFLWTDSAVWDAEVSAFGQDEYVRNHAMISPSKAYSIPEFLSHRVVFEDRIRRVSPWVLQYVVSDYSREGADRPTEQSLLFVRNQYTGEYLTADAYVRSIIDEHTGFDWNDGFRRHFVSMRSHASNTSMWLLETHGTPNKGFRLRNYASQCYLGSTFRTFPDVLADRTNDTLFHQLYMSLESACISQPTQMASTIFAVDDLSHHGNVPDLVMNKRSRSLHALVTHALSILSGQLRLYKFRASYAHLQDTPPEILETDVRLTLNGVTVVLLLSLLCCAKRFAHLQRMDLKSIDVTRFLACENHKTLSCNYFLGFLFICGHLFLVIAMGLPCPYGRRVVSSVALLTVCDLWTDTLLEQRLVGAGRARSGATK